MTKPPAWPAKTVARQGRISNEKAPATAVTAPGCGRLNLKESRRD